MYKCKSITLPDGKTIVPARERIIFLKEEKIDYELETEHSHDEFGHIVCKAVLTVHIGGQTRVYPGTSAADKTEPFCYETTETKAIGRACAAFGIGIEDSYASAEETLDALKVKPFDTDAVPAVTVQNAMAEAIQDATSRGEKLTEATNRKVGKRNIPKVEPDPEPVKAIGEEPVVEPEPVYVPVMPPPVDDDPFATKEEKAAKIAPVMEVVKPVVEPVLERPILEPKPEAKAKTIPADSPNKFGIKVPELSDKGTRPWSSVLALDDAITKAGLTPKQVKDSILALHPEYSGWEEEDILGAAASDHLHSALNKC